MNERLKASICVGIVVAGLLFTSWFMTCMLIRFIAACFGLEFKSSSATIIWLFIFLSRELVTSKRFRKGINNDRTV